MVFAYASVTFINFLDGLNYVNTYVKRKLRIIAVNGKLGSLVLKTKVTIKINETKIKQHN